MTLEHYPGMTERAMAAIAAEAEARWSLLGCTVIHRVGRLLPRRDRSCSCSPPPRIAPRRWRRPRFLIDWLKTRAPFWKKEEFADGGAAWVEAREADDAAAARWRQLPA